MLRRNLASVDAQPGRKPAGYMWREPRPGPQRPAWSQNHRARCPWLSEQPPVVTQQHIKSSRNGWKLKDAGPNISRVCLPDYNVTFGPAVRGIIFIPVAPSPHSTGHLPHTAAGNCWPVSKRVRGSLEAPLPSSACQDLWQPERKLPALITILPKHWWGSLIDELFDQNSQPLKHQTHRTLKLILH